MSDDLCHVSVTGVTENVASFSARPVRTGVAAADAERVADRAAYTEPHHVPGGIRDVIVNGQLVLEGGG